MTPSRPLLVLLGWLGSLVVAQRVTAQQGAEESAARRVIATSALAAKEYAEGVVDGQAVSAAEIEEARLFLEESRRATSSLPEALRPQARAMVDSLLGVVEATGDPARVVVLAEALGDEIRTAFGGLAEPIPALRPPLSEGRHLFRRHCTECHGTSGAGDGFRAPNLDPPPGNLTDPVGLADLSPLDTYRKVRIGVAGTDMPSFEDDLTDEQIWTVVWYVVRLRSTDSVVAAGNAAMRDACRSCETLRTSGVPLLAALKAELADPEVQARYNDHELGALVRDGGLWGGRSVDSTLSAAVVAYLRTLPFAEEADTETGAAFATVRTELARALRAVRGGDADEAVTRTVDAYTRFEGMESELAVRDANLAAVLETGFAEFRARAARGDSLHQIAGSFRTLAGNLDAAEARLVQRQSTVGLFTQSFILLLREGLEAILIVGALATLVVRAGAPERKREIWLGVGVAIVASLATAVLIETVFRISAAQQEVLEGVTILLATVILVFVSYWLLAKVEVNRWRAFVAAQVHRALNTGSIAALAATAFLAVYREGFETVLFYKALFITAEGQGAGAIMMGGVVALVALIGIYLGIAFAGLRIPMRAFFGVTSAVLFYMAFTFAGKGVAELQESELIKTTLLDWAPRVPWMGIYPTVQSLTLQGLLLALVAFGLVWTFFMQPQHATPRLS